jgi:hypothetical protein
MTLVQRLADGLLEPFDFVSDHQFAAFKLDYTQIVGGKMHERFVQFGFENPVFPLKFNEMRLDGHTKPPRLSEIRFDPDE